MGNEPFLHVKIPLSPTMNQSYERVTYSKYNRQKRRREYTHTLAASKALALFKEEAEESLRDQRGGQDWNTINHIREMWEQKVHTHLEITIWYYLDSMWRSDADGRIKATQDAVFIFMKLNDNMVVDTHVYKRLAEGKPYADVIVKIVDGFEYPDIKTRKKKESVEEGKEDMDEATKRQIARMRKRGAALAPTVRSI